MKLGDLILVACRDLRRQPLRSLLTIIALIISTTILLTILAISIGGRQAIVEQFGSDDSLATISVTPNQASAGLSPFGSVQEVHAGTTKLDDTMVAMFQDVSHVVTASPRVHIWELHHFSIEGSDKQFVAQAEGIPSDAPMPLKAGAMFNANDDKDTVILGYAYAKELGYDNPDALVGKTITFTTQKGYRGIGAAIPPVGVSQQQAEAFNQIETTVTARIVGVTDRGINQNGVFLPLGWAHSIRTARYSEAAGEKQIDQIAADGYTSIQLTVDAPVNVTSVSEFIEQSGYGQLSSLAQVEKLQQFTAMIWIVLGSVALIAIIASMLGVVNTMLMTVSEQRYVIGVWRAVGARKRIIVRMFLVQSAVLGFAGGSIGTGLGYVVSYYVDEYARSLLNAQGLMVAHIATIPLWLATGTIVATTVFGVLAGLYPAYRAARQDPSAALSNGQ